MRVAAARRRARAAAAHRLEDAIADAVRLAPALTSERVPLSALAGRRLARPVTARADLPAFDNSAMDGYAVRAADGCAIVHVRGESAAGAPVAGPLEPGTAWRISTGAPLPAGADAVVRQEDADASEDTIRIGRPPVPGRDIRRRGEDLRAGAAVLAAGTVIAAHHVAAVAAAGHGHAWCERRPRVALAVAGDELARPGAPLLPGQVYDANLAGLRAQIAAAADVVAAVGVADDPAATLDAVRGLLDGRLCRDGAPPDLLITAGGAAAGPHDHLRAALERLGVELIVSRVRMQPGQPTAIGARGGQAVLALPGNPVSAAVGAHVFGGALLGRPVTFEERAPLAAPVRVRAGLAQLLRCRIGASGLLALPRQGSADISSLAAAQALAWIPEEADDVPAGSMVRMARLG